MSPRLLDERQIVKRRHLQVRQPALPRAKQLPRPPQSKIRLRHLEPVTRRLHNLQPLVDLFRLGFRNEDAVTVLRASPHSPSVLVQLRKPKPLRAVDHHHRRVRNIDTHLNNRRRDQHVNIAVPKLPHHALLLRGAHPTVKQPDVQVRKHLPRESLVLRHRRLGRHRLRFLYQRADDERLPSLGCLLPDEPIRAVAFVGRHDGCPYRRPAGGHLMDR